jgi:hypothetical protein
MALTWKNILAIVFAVVALFLLAAVPAAEASETPTFTDVEESTELIAEKSDWVPEPGPTSNQHERLPGSPGGVHVIGGGSSNSRLTVSELEVLPGGAAGVAATGIRGPDTA